MRWDRVQKIRKMPKKTEHTNERKAQRAKLPKAKGKQNRRQEIELNFDSETPKMPRHTRRQDH